jgi:hypothetical protein
MQGEPLKYAKKAAIAAVEQLADGDLLTIAAFSTYGRVVFPMQPLNASTRSNAHSAISGLGDEERRNTMEGFKKTFEQFERFKSREDVGRHIIIITNGDPNQGTTGGEAVEEEIIEKARDRNISVSTFGFRYFDRSGEDFNEDVLYTLAEKTGGRYHYIWDVEKMVLMVQREASRIANATARDVRVEIIAPGRSSEIGGVEGARVQDDGKLFVGDMAPGAFRLIIFEIQGRPKRQRDCEVIVTYIEPDRMSEREIRSYLEIPLTSGSTRLNPDFAPRIIVFDLQASLAETTPNLKKNRREYTVVYRDKIKELEQENVLLDSDYISEALDYYESFERDLMNSTVENSVVIKLIKYRARQILYGQ